MKTISSIAAVCVCGLAASAGAQAPPDYDFNFITIGDVGNPDYDYVDSRGVPRPIGGVDYEYRIARTEVTTAQYVDYLNARADAGDVNLVNAPSIWGGGFNSDTGRWFTTPELAMLPVAGVSWYSAAVFTNWLHNGKGTTPDDFNYGAYNTDTFTDDDTTTDQNTRSPNAKYWIPSWSEWAKAAHWDPNKDGPGQGGYWQYSDSSDTELVPGPPGVGETMAGLDVPDNEAFFVPLESYKEVQSPWGLLDLSGGGSEWTEGWNFDELRRRRIWDGNAAGLSTWNPDSMFPDNPDLIDWRGSDQPGLAFNRTTLRVASLVPSPTSSAPMILLVVLGIIKLRR